MKDIIKVSIGLINIHAEEGENFFKDIFI